MPMLVRTPEEIFRAEKKDLCILISQEGSDQERFSGRAKTPEGLRMIQAWIKDQLPDVKQELLAPSEYSGMICGGIGDQVRVDFSPEQLKTFCDRWEVNDTSTDSRFQCFIAPYKKWHEEHGRFVPTQDQPTVVGVTVWWYTPIGFIHHQLSAEHLDENAWNPHPANHHDIWAHAVHLWPTLAELDTDDLCYGGIQQNRESMTWTAIYTPPLWKGKPKTFQPSEPQIRDWFHLPEDTEVIEDSY